MTRPAAPRVTFPVLLGWCTALVRDQLAKILAGNPHANVKAQTLLARKPGARSPFGSRRRQTPGGTRRRAARGTVLATDSKLKAHLDGILYVQEHLVPGAVAPAIEGPDLADVSFKLSDYRGKVVLLDFWGYW